MPRPRLTHPDIATPEGQLVLYLQHLMEERQMTPEDIADAAHVSRAAVFSWLSGGCGPSFRLWPAIAKGLGLATWQDLVPPPSFVESLAAERVCRLEA